MSTSQLKRPKLSIDLDANTLKRTKFSDSNIDLPTSADEENTDQAISNQSPPLTPEYFFTENFNHATVDLNEPTSPLTPLEELRGFLDSTSISTSISKWCRSGESNWLLKDETEESLKGPAWPCM